MLRPFPALRSATTWATTEDKLHCKRKENPRRFTTQGSTKSWQAPIGRVARRKIRLSLLRARGCSTQIRADTLAISQLHQSTGLDIRQAQQSLSTNQNAKKSMSALEKDMPSAEEPPPTPPRSPPDADAKPASTDTESNHTTNITKEPTKSITVRLHYLAPLSLSMRRSSRCK